MKFPAKTQYACQAMIELALNYNKVEPYQLQAIAQAQGIPEKFLVQILTRLKNAGLILSFRGNAGGYKLVRKPDEITLADIVRAIDPDMIEFYYSLSKDEKHVRNVLIGTWSEVNQIMAERMENISIEDIIKKASGTQAMYHI